MDNFPNKKFKNMLKKFDMISEKGQNAPGLVFVGGKTENPSEKIALERAERYRACAVYFRRFVDGRPPIPQIYIYDFTQSGKNDTDLIELYKKLWNSARVPLFFVFFKTEVKIFSCLNKTRLIRN